MTDTIKVHRAAEADLPSVKLLLGELLEAVEDKGSLDIVRAMENCRALLKDPDHFMLVAKDVGGVAGFIHFMTRQSVMHSRPSGLIDELVVSQKARSRGVGKLLVQAAARKCRELDCCELEVSTEKSNAAARRFYKACGFDEDAVLLEMEL